jgi:Family of unknown function (DUF6778)
MFDLGKGLSFGFALLALAGCVSGTTSGGRIEADTNTFEAPIGVSAATVESWRLARVDVQLGPDMTVSTNPNEQFPRERIVWWGEPAGDRRAQVRKIVGDAVTAGASGLRGSRDVVLDVNLRLFHAVTPRAVANRYYAWHDIQFIITVRDARTGKIITTSSPIDADLEAYRGNAAKEAAAKGETQKVRISRKISSAVHAWLQSSGATIARSASTSRQAPVQRATPAKQPARAAAPAKPPATTQPQSVRTEPAALTTPGSASEPSPLQPEAPSLPPIVPDPSTLGPTQPEPPEIASSSAEDVAAN